MPHDKTVLVMGLGYIGLPTSVTLANAGVKVKGYDVNPAVTSALRGGRIHIVEPFLQEEFEDAVSSGNLAFVDKYEPADIFIIAVATPFKRGGAGDPEADLTYVFSAARMVGEVLAKGNLVILESTVPPGTTGEMTRLLVETSGLSEDEFFTAHCPERVMPGRILHELRHNDRVIGASRHEGAEKAHLLYSKVVTEGRIILTDDKTAEMCKLAENTCRDINIAYANELSIIADRVGVDVYKVIEIANLHPRINILRPGVGVGGHCIAVDPWFLAQAGGNEAGLIAAARRRNDNKTNWVCEKVSRLCGGLEDKTVTVLGLAFKEDVDDIRESAAIRLCDMLRAKGARVVACEPYVNRPEINGIPNLPFAEALEAGDFCVVAVGHRQFAENAALIKKRRYYDCAGICR